LPELDGVKRRLTDIQSDVASKPSIVPVPNNLPYIVAVVLMMIIGVGGVVTISLARPNQDNTSIITTILGFLAPTTLSLLAFMKAQETHLSVNSRLDAFMRNAELAARVQGVIEGRSQGRDDANLRTDALAQQSPTKVEITNIPPQGAK
jgi:hypothetical protein